MKRPNKFLYGCALAIGVSASAATLPSDWQHEQRFDVSATGLVKISLPVETLDVARPALEDLRIYDDAGNEIPYLIERPTPPKRIVQDAKSFHVSLNANNTTITIESGLAQPLDGISLKTPAGDFIKAVRVEESSDGKNWQLIDQGRPIFRQSNGANNLKISFLSRISRWLRLTVDDQHSQPIPFTGAQVHAVAGEVVPGESIPVSISERNENVGVTRLALNLGAANMDIASVQIETVEPLFTRQITLAIPQISQDAIREQIIGQGTIYRIAVEGQTASANLSVPLGTVIHSRELIVLLQNGDNSPLSISSVRVERRPIFLIFLARQTGRFHLLTGNAHCALPHYDLAGLNIDLKSVPVFPVKFSQPSENPDFRAQETLSGLGAGIVPLDVSEWKFRKPIKISSPNAQQLELDADVLAHAIPDFADLRVMNGSNQVPYIIQRTSISRSLSPVVTSTNDAKNPRLSRWVIKLPRAGLPVTRLACISQTSLFDRSLSLYENLSDERGDKYRRDLGHASWMQTPEHKSKEFVLTLDSSPQSDTLFLETENGDNPPIKLEKFTTSYPVTRLLFKAQLEDDVFLYYGNPRATTPRYDLSLVANQLLAAEKQIATLSDEQQLKKSSWRENKNPGKGGVLFWGILALVVVVLLLIISRLLPKTPSP